MKSGLHIPQPCKKKWDAMIPDKNGKFCDSCSKTVIDFSKMKQPEIQKYYIENADSGSICGYFKRNQVETENSGYQKIKNRLNRIRIKPIQRMALFSLSLLFSLTSCVGKVVAPERPIIIDDTFTDNEISAESQDTVKKPDTLKQKTHSEK